MNFEPVYIEAVDIPDAWFQCIYEILNKGFKYEIQYGSYVGQTRLEFDWVTVFIKYPYIEPYDRMLPEIPPYLNIPNPVDYGYVEQYLPYLMTDEKKEAEDYTYGQRLTGFLPQYIDGLHPDFTMRVGQVEYWTRVLKKTPNTNQAILQVAQPDDCFLDDPPCLRQIDLRIKDDMLIFYPYFRSWDLFSGFPANLAGIAVLQKYMADEIGVASGPICAASKGLHIYGYVEELAKLRCWK